MGDVGSGVGTILEVLAPQTFWYLSRASGIVALVLLTMSVCLGVLLSTRALKPLDRPAWLLAMHRFTSSAALIATGVHLAGLAADNYVYFGWAELFVPGASGWNTLPVAVGVIAFYLLILVQGTSLLLRLLPKRLWRAVHFSSYAALWAAVVHGALAGTDAASRAYQLTGLTLTLLATTAALLRALIGGASRRTANRPDHPRPAS